MADPTTDEYRELIEVFGHAFHSVKEEEDECFRSWADRMFLAGIVALEKAGLITVLLPEAPSGQGKEPTHDRNSPSPPGYGRDGLPVSAGVSWRVGAGRNARRIVEALLPHACAHQIAANLARAARIHGNGDAAEIERMDRGFLEPILERLADNLRLALRLERAKDIVMGLTYDKPISVAMVALTHLINALVDAGLWEPEERFLIAWDELGTATYNTVDNGRHLDAAEPEAAEAARRAIEILRLEGYYA